MSRQLPAEFALVAACCRWPPSPGRVAAVRAAAAVPLDWNHFEKVAVRQRVVPLARDGLLRAGVRLPPDLDKRLKKAASEAAREALLRASETLRLQRLCDEAKLPAVFVKGESLAILAYGSIGLKQAVDIDLLIRPADGLAARHLLQRLGYELIAPPGLDDRKFTRFLRYAQECVFRKPSLGCQVELHPRLVQNPHLLPTICAGSETQSVAIGNASVKTLADNALFAHLCVHGTFHAWYRLKWLADVAAFLAHRNDSEIDRLHRAAMALGAGRTSGVALLLCCRLLGLSLSGGLLRELRADRVTTALVANAMQCLTYGGGSAQYSFYSVLGMRIYFSSFFLMQGHRYFRAELAQKLIPTEDRMLFPLPNSLSFLYVFLRVPLWLLRISHRSLLSGIAGYRARHFKRSPKD